ncbi:MAG: hypothetical protein HXY24_07215, partial [Rubrivivax sp.]|nr:hypothetical protein [Rubrivivax sp.]
MATPAPLPRPAVTASCVVLPLVAWVALFELNAWAFAAFTWAQGIAWIFLPAAVRVLAVLVCGRVAVLGLFAGALLTSGEVYAGDAAAAVLGPALSAIGPWLAVELFRLATRMPLDLRGLTPGHLLALSVLSALCNVVPHNVFFWLTGIRADPFTGMLPMFAGDLAGIFIVLYAVRFALRLVDRTRVRSTSRSANRTAYST